MQRSKTLAYLLVLLGLSAPAVAQRGQDLPAGTQPAQWRVIWQEDPAHAALIAWTTDTAGTSNLYVDPQSRGGTTANYTQQVSCSDERHSLAFDYYHHCDLTGLTPSTRYYFVMETDGVVSEELYFITAPDGPDAPFKMLFGGDSRSNSTRRRSINQVIAEMVRNDPDILALSHGGDYIERGTSWSQWKQWLSDFELTTGPDGRVLPIIATRGNHEAVGALFGEVLGGAGTGSNYYTTTIGRFVLVTLNTETTQSGDQRNWLEAELQQAGTHARWITAQYHRPAWPAVKQPSGAKMHWVPLFEAHDLDMVFESDGHALKRTVPIRDNQHDSSGVTYVGEGGLGVGQRTPDRTRWYLEAPGFAESAHHIQKVTVTASTLLYEALDPDGTVLDQVTLTARNRGNTPPPVDAGMPADAGMPPVDAGRVDSGPTADAGADAGSISDTGVLVDAGTGAPDAGAIPDSGEVVTQPGDSGCVCVSQARTSSWLAALLILPLWGLRRRRTR